MENRLFIIMAFFAVAVVSPMNIFGWGGGHDHVNRLALTVMPPEIKSFLGEESAQKFIEWSHAPDNFSPWAELKYVTICAEDMEVLKPVLTFKELTLGGNQLDQKYRHLQYGVKYHGVGLCDEYPAIMYPENWESGGYDGVLEPGMCLCVEAYIGEVGGKEGVKLEDQIVITENGYELLTHFHHDPRLLD